MTDSGKDRLKIPSFSVILILIVLIVIGAGLMPLLNVQYTPSVKEKSLTVSFGWYGASARVVEADVTSKIEGVLASVKGVSHISSTSLKGSGAVGVSFKKGVSIDAVRFEIASLMRQLYPKLPEGVTYPTLSISSSGEQQSPLLSYTLHAGVPTYQIESYARENIVNELALIKGISSISLTGATPFFIEIAYDPAKLRSYAISLDELIRGINAGLDRNDVVGNVMHEERAGEEREITVILSNGNRDFDFDRIVIRSSGDRIVRLGDLATVRYKEELPAMYYRINGLNTINLTVYPDKHVNTINLAARVRERMDQLQKTFPSGFSATLAYDSSEFVKGELHKIFLRTVLSVLILLLFVFLVSRSLRYLLIITLTLMANIFIAFIFYYFFDLEIHLYSLAGITVSLGIIIDTSIIMVDHYGYYRDRKAFVAILAAVLTTIGSLIVVFFLPDQLKVNLVDFSAVMIVNLAISIFIALIFVPALMDKLPVRRRKRKNNRRRMKRLLRFNRVYGRYILFGKKYRWAFVLVLILGFGLPVYMLPDKIKEEPDKEVPFWTGVYNRTLGGSWYLEHLKPVVDRGLGGTLTPFLKKLSGRNYFREPQRTTLLIQAAMPEGCTVQQLNDVMRMMENFLSQFDEIDMFRTSIYDYDSGMIEVTFKKEAEKNRFPVMLKNAAISKAINYGGATWSISGIDENGFSNNVTSNYKTHRIVLTGYNYDRLYRYAEQVLADLSANKRVSDPGIYGRVSFGNSLPRNEYYISFDPDRVAMSGVDLSTLYGSLQDKLYSQRLNSYFDGRSVLGVALVSSEQDRFDVWHLRNEHISAGGKNIRFSELGDIAKRRTGNDIYKYDQQYTLTVAYDFVGPYELSRKVAASEVDRMNDEVFPLGFKARVDNFYGWGQDGANRQYLLILLVITIIFFCCAILFESLRQPLIILLLIPVSFIGVFLTFSTTGFTFDQGGFASMVLLCGTVVNAGIYIINQYNLTCRAGGGPSLRNFLKSYNHKIVPIMLTIFSSVLGLVPFLYDGKSDVFWFAFAVGSMGGMLFSIVALIFYLPLFIPMDLPSRRQRRRQRRREAGA